MKTLAYLKARKVNLRNCIAVASPLSSYWCMLQQEYKQVKIQIDQIEQNILVRRLEQ